MSRPPTSRGHPRCDDAELLRQRAHHHSLRERRPRVHLGRLPLRLRLRRAGRNRRRARHHADRRDARAISRWFASAAIKGLSPPSTAPGPSVLRGATSARWSISSVALRPERSRKYRPRMGAGPWPACSPATSRGWKSGRCWWRKCSMPAEMLAAVYYGPEDLRLVQRPLPEFGPDEALLRVKAASICGTDMRILHGAHRKYGEGTVRIPGHEVVGEVAAVGKDVADIEPGQMVFVAPNTGCGHCRQCLSGNNNLCADYQADRRDAGRRLRRVYAHPRRGRQPGQRDAANRGRLARGRGAGRAVRVRAARAGCRGDSGGRRRRDRGRRSHRRHAHHAGPSAGRGPDLSPAT